MSHLGSIQVTDRDRTLLLGAPALLILIAYGYLLARGPSLRIRNLAVQVAAARAEQPSTEALAQQVAARARLTEQVALARAELEPARRALDRQLDAWEDRSRRLQANDDLAVLWRRHGLTLLEQSTAPVADAALTPLIERLQQQTRVLLNREFGPTLWEVRLEGGFPSVREALQEIIDTDLPVIPASLEMQRKPQTSAQLWTVRLWQ